MQPDTTVRLGNLGDLPLFVAPAQISANRHELVKYAGGRGSSDYFRCLDTVQSVRIPCPIDRTLGLPLTFDLAQPDAAAIVSAIAESPELPAAVTIAPVHGSQVASIRLRVAEAIADLAAFDERAAAMVRDLVGAVVLVDTPYCEGGSLWHALGVIWLSPTQQWSIAKYAESLLHETVHQATFLDDMVNRLFAVESSRLADPSALVASPIRGVPRRFDYTLHATVVALVLAHYLACRNESERTEQMIVGAQESLQQMAAKRQFLTAHGNHVLGELIRYRREFVSGFLS